MSLRKICPGIDPHDGHVWKREHADLDILIYRTSPSFTSGAFNIKYLTAAPEPSCERSKKKNKRNQKPYRVPKSSLII